MKKILILILLVLFCSDSAFGSEFEEALKKAKRGGADAQYYIGEMYWYGQGTTQNYKKAFYWYKKLAEQGNQFAQLELGLMYVEGQETTQNYKKGYIKNMS